MQDSISLFRTQNREPLLSRHESVPLRRIVLRGGRNYLRALRAAEMAAWENARPSRTALKASVRQHPYRRGVRFSNVSAPSPGPSVGGASEDSRFVSYIAE